MHAYIHIIHSRDNIDSTDGIETFDFIGTIHVALNFLSMYDFYFLPNYHSICQSQKLIHP